MKKLTVIIPIPRGASAEVVESIKAISKGNVEIILEEGNNPSINRNRGVRKAKTPFVAFVNSHSIVSKSWLSNALNFMQKNPGIDIVGGPQHNSPDESVFGRSSGYAMSSPFGSGGIWRRYAGKKLILDADETMITSSNIIARRKVFDKVMFDPQLYPGEDPKFISDAKSKGFRVAYSPDIIVYNRRRKDIFSLAKQVFFYGKVRPAKESLKETLKRPFFLVPSVFLLYLLSLFFVDFYLYSIPLYLYLILLAGSSAHLAASNKDFASFFLLPFVFPTIHLSYGLGFIVGCIQKLFKSRKSRA